MVQYCGSNCMSCIGQVVCFVLCCRKKKQKSEENQQNFELHDSSRPQTTVGDSADDGSIYNGSSTYDNQTVIRRQPYAESGTSGVYMSETSLYSGSITENPSELKLEFSCELKGTMEVGGIPQPVKGVLSITPDKIDKFQLPDRSIYAVNPGLTNTINIHHKSSRTDSLKKQRSNSKTPQPLPRVLDKISSSIREQGEIISEADNEEYYNEPKPPLPVKKGNTQDPTKSYVPVYENYTWKTEGTRSRAVTTNENNLQNTNVKFSTKDTPMTNDHQEDHMYEEINPKYQNLKTDDYEIYMS